MRKLFNIAGAVILLISGISCKDDFLSKNEKDFYTLSDTLKLNNSMTNVEAPIQLPVLVDCAYRVFIQPKWLSFNSMTGNVKDGKFILGFDVLNNDIVGGYQIHYATLMIDIEDLGIVTFTVSYENFGTPSIQCSVSSIDFKTPDSRSVTIKNTADGILKWEITGIPDWLIISPVSGILFKDQSTIISISLDQIYLINNPHLSWNLTIQSNSTSGNLTIPVNIDEIVLMPNEVQQIEGIVTDADYSQESDIMIISTKSPGRLLIYNTVTNITSSLQLAETPNCISISEDGHKAVVGYNAALISYIDLDELRIIKNFSIDCVPFDIALGNNGWCYITPKDQENQKLRNLNLTADELFTSEYQDFFNENTLINKVYGKSCLVGTRTTSSPSGIFLLDISKGKARDTLTYYHTSLSKFWISKDGTRLYPSCEKKIYLLPPFDENFHPYDPDLYGLIESDFPNISAFAECPDSNAIFITSTYSDNDTQYDAIIERHNLVSLSLLKTYPVSPVYVEENGTRELYKTIPIYLFVQKNGSRLYAIKNLREYYHKDYWTIESIIPAGH